MVRGEVEARGAFLDALDATLARGSSTVAVIRVNLDRFGRIRQSFGVEIANEVLDVLDQRLRQAVGPEQTVLRYGEGSYAATVTVDTVEDEELENIAMAIVEQLSEPMDVDSGLRIAVGTNVGIAAAADFDHVDADGLVSGAEVAVERADAIGSRRVMVYDATQTETQTQPPTLYRDMLGAIEAGQFTPVFQPIVHIPDRSIYGVEALVRWQHPEHGQLPPGAFIEEAERSGLIRSIDSVVRNQAMSVCASCHGSHQVTLSINLSAIDLDAASLLDDIAETIEAAKLDPSKVIFEITETALAQHWSRSRRRLEAIKELGVRLAIDDFGSGHMFLDRLGTGLFDVLKADRSLVIGEDDNRRATALLSGVVWLAHRLGMTVTAEGVETQAQLDRVIAAGCDHAQGFLFGRPMPAHEFAAILDRQTTL